MFPCLIDLVRLTSASLRNFPNREYVHFGISPSFSVFFFSLVLFFLIYNLISMGNAQSWQGQSMNRLNFRLHSCRFFFTLVTLLCVSCCVPSNVVYRSLNKPIDAAMDHNATPTPSDEAASTGANISGQTDQPKTSIRRDLGKLSTCFTISFALLLSSSIEIWQ